MIVGNQILSNSEDIKISKNTSYRSKISKFDGKIVECDSFPSPIGTICKIQCNDENFVTGEIIGFKENKNLIAVHDQNANLVLGSKVDALNTSNNIYVGENLLGRVIDSFGNPIDNKKKLSLSEKWPLNGKPINPMQREPISQPLDVGIRAINSLFTVGRGQRLGIIAGSGVGKSILLGMMTKFTSADIVVVALIGERGRELGNFVSEILNETTKKRTVIVAVPADKSPLLRIKGAERATSIAEYFRSRGKNVLLIMDSLTRIAHAKREVGLALGEQPTSKGYPPSVISMIPNLIERTGAGGENEGSITSFYTILADSDDTNDPVVDTARAILDGHIVLSREFAQLGIFPAIDLNQSLSRVMNSIINDEHKKKAEFIKKMFSIYQENKDLVLMGGYTQGQNEEIDKALELWPRICELIKQDLREEASFDESINKLKKNELKNMAKKKYDILSKLKKIRKNKLVSNLGTLNKEQQKLERINSELKDMLDDSKFEIGRTISSGAVRQVSTFRKNLQDKIQVSENREAHLKKEIDTYLNEISKVNKQQEKIEEKKKENFAILEQNKEIRNSIIPRVKNL